MHAIEGMEWGKGFSGMVWIWISGHEGDILFRLHIWHEGGLDRIGFIENSAVDRLHQKRYHSDELSDYGERSITSVLVCGLSTESIVKVMRRIPIGSPFLETQCYTSRW